MTRDRDNGGADTNNKCEATVAMQRRTNEPRERTEDRAILFTKGATGASRSPAMRLVDRYLRMAVDRGSSDLHLEYRATDSAGLRTLEPRNAEATTSEPAASVAIRARVDGRLRNVEPPPANLAASLLTRLRLLARVDLSEKRLPQDGRFSFSNGDKTIDVRAAFVPVHGGEKVVLRFLRRNDRALSLTELGLDDEQLARVDSAVATAGGLVVIAGPTGSGKTTTAYALVDRMHDPSLSVITAEDPVERTLEGVAQIAVDDECGRTFARVLRGILRLDPDIILIGEIRDERSAEIACRAALTGHRVVTTLHASDTREARIRLVDIGVPEPMLAATVKLIVAQRLLRRLCDRCRVTEPAPESARETFRAAGLAVPEHLAAAAGCVHCDDTGYATRFPVFEIFERNPAAGESADPRSADGGLLVRALGRVANRETTLEEALSQCPAPQAGPTRAPMR